MSEPPKPLEPEEIERLRRIASILERIDGWCLVNRAIGKFVFIGIIGSLIWFSNLLDAIKNLLGLKQ